MKSDTSRVEYLHDHVLLHCITDLKSAAVILTALKKQYPNLKKVAIKSRSVWNILDQELRNKKGDAPQSTWGEPFDTIDIYQA